MSENKKGQQEPAQTRDGQEPPESGYEPQPSSEAPERSSDVQAPGGPDSSNEPPPRPGSNAPAWLALLLALAAGGLAGWQWWLSETNDESGRFGPRIEQQASAVESQSRRLDELDERLGGVETRLDELAGRLDARDFDPAAMRRDIQSRAEADAELRQQVTSLSERLDGAVSDLESQLEQAGAARSDRIEESMAEARFRLGLIEVAGLLRLGQSRAELAADPAGAIAAYRRAQSRLEAIDDVRLERLRQLVARELEALRSVESTDWPALTGQLSALESETAQWPVAGAREPGTDESPMEDGGMETEDGWWSSMRASLGGLVRVTPREAAPLTSAAVESVRERLRLHLAAAQVAAARRSTGELARHLEVAEDLTRAHFDTSDESVLRALEGISEAASVDLPSLPELGSALAEAERRLAGS